ncbi:hypothetical protein E4T52_13735 [Aureobasidium sp. EXF-3400]|nr:hypothetical protein E4T51_11907 [Aureobasidium sp. EXF-12344]KAI4771264.1 hypothetical protein E4T52_13735 [Aureobasidium sp. EXF-3400]
MARSTATDTSDPIYFYSTNERPHGIFSQFQKCTFTDPNYPDIKFHGTEQFMMYGKALTFKDSDIGNSDIAAKIIDAKTSKAQKALGRDLKGFSDKIWDTVKLGIVERGNYLKFTQNERFKKVLLETGDRLLVEASKNDKIWGIGYGATDAKRVSRDKWGQNLLGIALMKVRDKIGAEEAKEEGDEEVDDSDQETTDEEADEETDEQPKTLNSSTVSKRKYDTITIEDSDDEPSKPETTASKKARTKSIADEDEQIHHTIGSTKGKHTEDDLLGILTKKAADDSMINSGK